MANKMVANIQSLSAGVKGLTKDIEGLYKALEKVQGVAAKAVTDARGAVNSTGGQGGIGHGSPLFTNPARFTPLAMPTGMGGDMSLTSSVMSTSMGKFSTPGVGLMAAQGGLGIAAAGYAGVPDLSSTGARALGYYQAGITSPGINRGQLERATMRAMGNGLSSVGSDAITAAIIASRGYTPGGQNYLNIASQVGGAYRYLGMPNGAAAQAISGFGMGPMAANLYQYGISVYEGNKLKSTGTIARELMGYMGGAGATPEQVRQSYTRGALGANLGSMGFSDAQQQILYQAMIDIASGRNPDLASAKPGKGNSNKLLTASGKISASTSELMGKGENSMINGLDKAAGVVNTFNQALGEVIGPLAQLKGLIGGVGGSNAGPGIGTLGGTLFSLGKKVAGTALIGAGIAGEVGSFGLSTPMSAAAVAGGVHLLTSGGGRPGYGAAIGRGGGSPVAGGISSGYGAVDNSGIWAGTNNKHMGQDYNVPVGTPVKAAMTGTVSKDGVSADYGTAILIDHPNGYQTLYAHLSAKDVKPGDQVKEGQVIGKSGKSGNVTGPHLHFELRKGKNNPVDPNQILKGSVNYLSMDYASLLPTEKDVLGKGANTKADTSLSKSGKPKSLVSSLKDASVDQKNWATSLLQNLGAPITDANLAALTTWMRYEGGHWKNSAAYNPLNTTLGRDGATNMNKVGVKAYTSWDQGLEATLSTLTGPNADKRGYSAIVSALRSGSDANAILQAINNSAWRSGKTNHPGYNFPTIKGGGSVAYGADLPQLTPPVGNTVNITVNVQSASEQEAVRFAKRVKDLLRNEKEISQMGNR